MCTHYLKMKNKKQHAQCTHREKTPMNVDSILCVFCFTDFHHILHILRFVSLRFSLVWLNNRGNKSLNLKNNGKKHEMFALEWQDK